MCLYKRLGRIANPSGDIAIRFAISYQLSRIRGGVDICAPLGLSLALPVALPVMSPVGPLPHINHSTFNSIHMPRAYA